MLCLVVIRGCSGELAEGYHYGQDSANCCQCLGCSASADKEGEVSQNVEGGSTRQAAQVDCSQTCANCHHMRVAGTSSSRLHQQFLILALSEP